jgi:hypothetical protein
MRRGTTPGRHTGETRSPARARINRCRFLLVIDNAPLQAAAWTELQRARKRLEKATADLHRHEEVDEPAFQAWLGRTFGKLMNTARELAMQVATKQRLVDDVSQEAFFSDRSEAQVWREWQRHGGAPPPEKAGKSESENFGTERNGRGGGDAWHDEDEDFDKAFEEFSRFFEGGMGSGEFMRGRVEAPTVSTEARAIYRRLVQHLHPDRGGAWTPARARLWEQVQQAWEARDADWLARLEVEWEAATDLLGPTSAVGRLRAALVEIDAARRDADRKLRLYRKQRAWRFSLRPTTSEFALVIERSLRADCEAMRELLEDLQMRVTNWERESRRKTRKGRRQNHDMFAPGELW